MVSDLNVELPSIKPEVVVHEPVRVLKTEVFSAKPEANVKELLKALARPLT